MKATKTPSITHASHLIALALGACVLPSCLSEQQAMGILDQSVKSAAISAIQQSDPIFGRRGDHYGGGYSSDYGSGYDGGLGAGSFSGDGYSGARGVEEYPGGTGSSLAGSGSMNGELFEDPETGAVYQRVR